VREYEFDCDCDCVCVNVIICTLLTHEPIHTHMHSQDDYKDEVKAKTIYAPTLYDRCYLRSLYDAINERFRNDKVCSEREEI
jgi:hypothetical protein